MPRAYREPAHLFGVPEVILLGLSFDSHRLYGAYSGYHLVHIASEYGILLAYKAVNGYELFLEEKRHECRKEYHDYYYAEKLRRDNCHIYQHAYKVSAAPDYVHKSPRNGLAYL